MSRLLWLLGEQSTPQRAPRHLAPSLGPRAALPGALAAVAVAVAAPAGYAQKQNLYTTCIDGKMYMVRPSPMTRGDASLYCAREFSFAAVAQINTVAEMAHLKSWLTTTGAVGDWLADAALLGCARQLPGLAVSGSVQADERRQQSAA
jgi:hypothetical protein